MPPSTPPHLGAPIDPDLAPADGRRRARGLDPGVLTAIAAGGVLGAEARYALSLWHPFSADQWPLTTWSVNLGGSFLLGVLMVVFTDLSSPHRLVRPFLGVGVLGGFTTFSTAMVDVHQLASAGHPVLAVGYLLGTALGALVAVLLGTLAARGAVGGWMRRRNRRGRRR
jgi:CrcB protein